MTWPAIDAPAMSKSIGQMRLSGLFTSAAMTRDAPSSTVEAKYAPDARASLSVSELTTATMTPRAPHAHETR